MKTFEIEQVEFEGLKFLTRKGSSDVKSLKEVIGKNGYRRKGFEVGGAQGWIDIGANIGAFTCLAASKGVAVEAYEPDPDSFALLEENVRLNQLGERVLLRNAAVVVKAKGPLEFHVNSAKGNFWRNSLYKKWRGGNTIAVDTVSLADVIRGDFDVKLDAEGAEMPLIEAFKERPAPRLVFEWSFDIDSSIPRFNEAVTKLQAFYENVVYGKFDQSLPAWPASWFPPCRTVWCS